MGMTFAVIPALRNDAGLYQQWAPHLLKNAYDPRPLYAAAKNGVTVGMAMTEKQGGSDLRATITHGAAGEQPPRLRRTLSHHRAQVVLFGADERSVPDAGADRKGPVVLHGHRLAAGRRVQSSEAATSQGQVRQ